MPRGNGCVSGGEARWRAQENEQARQRKGKAGKQRANEKKPEAQERKRHKLEGEKGQELKHDH